MSFPECVREELKRARSIHRVSQASLHEGYAILKEEVDELWDEIKKKARNRSMDTVREELVQIGAMAQRMAEDVGGFSREESCECDLCK